jgi:nitroimidazol reductase NimA-like FMN-containing flavoprotein (pyridoxamine 5'-phosphate oxidase superfamily)
MNMRRSDREITGLNEKLGILAECKVCRLGLTDGAQPYVIPLNFGYAVENDALTLYFHSATEGRKLAVIKQNNRACFEVDCGHQLIEGDRACAHGFAFQSIIGFGSIVIIEDVAEKAAALNHLMRHQTGKAITHPFDGRSLAAVTVYKMVVDEWSAKQKQAPKQA